MQEDTVLVFLSCSVKQQNQKVPAVPWTICRSGKITSDRSRDICTESYVCSSSSSRISAHHKAGLNPVLVAVLLSDLEFPIWEKVVSLCKHNGVGWVWWTCLMARTFVSFVRLCCQVSTNSFGISLWVMIKCCFAFPMQWSK